MPSVARTFEHELNKVDNWCRRYSYVLETRLKVNKYVLPELTSVPDLGVYYPRSLNFSKPIATKALKLRRFLDFIIFYFFERNLESFFKSYV